MRIQNTQIVLENREVDAEIQIFEKRDWQTIKSLYENWVNLSNLHKEMRGRGINLPEVISEGVFCLEFECARFLGSSGGIRTSFDCLDLNLLKRIQVKATSVAYDLSTFGPRSVWDDLYLVHFLPNGVLDGSYEVYKIDNDVIYNHKVNMNETFRDQQVTGRRPRLSLMKELIIPNGILPFKAGNIFDIAQDYLET